MKIALIVPKSLNPKQMYKEYPLGVGYIGTVLKEKGNTIKLYDQNVEFQNIEDLIEDIKKFTPNLIGFSILTPTYPVSIKILNSLKKQNINCKTFAGGIHPTIFPKECLKEGFDFVIRGEGEVAATQLVDYIEGKIDISDIPNISYKINDLIYENENKIVDIDINSLPIVDRSLYQIDKYTSHSISGTRGCPFSCKFCCNYNNLTKMNVKSRIRCVESIVEEISYLVEKFNAKDFFFTDDLFFTNINSLRKFERIMKDKNLDINYNAQLRVNMITDEVCTLLKSSGCKKIEVGVESGSQKILNEVCKGISIESIKRGISIAKRNDLRIKTNWIYGLPGGIEEQYKSIDLMLETRPDEISIHQLIPFPGTEYYNNRQKYGINIKNPTNFESFCYGDLDDNISYSYMSRLQYEKLMYDTIVALEGIGYISSDDQINKSKYIYTTPFDKKSLKTIEKEAI